MISVSIWRKTLVRARACTEGLALFDAIARQQPVTDARRLERIRIARWTPLHSVWGWVGSAGFAGWLEGKGIIPRANFSGANFSGANLSRANFSRAYLSGANFSGAYRGTSSKIPGWHTLVSGYLEREAEASHAAE